MVRVRVRLGKHALHVPMNLKPHFGEMRFGEVGFSETRFDEVVFNVTGFGEGRFGKTGFGAVEFGGTGFGEMLVDRMTASIPCCNEGSFFVRVHNYF